MSIHDEPTFSFSWCHIPDKCIATSFLGNRCLKMSVSKIGSDGKTSIFYCEDHNETDWFVWL